MLVAHAMDAGGIVLGFLVVATGAIGRRQLAFMHEVLDAFMAIDTIEAGVNGLGKGIRRKNEGNDLAIHLACGGWIEMTIEAIAVFESVGDGGAGTNEGK